MWQDLFINKSFGVFILLGLFQKRLWKIQIFNEEILDLLCASDNNSWVEANDASNRWPSLFLLFISKLQHVRGAV